MLWFRESIEAAVAKAQQNNAIFVVYIRGANGDDTSRMDETWEDGEVERICKEAGIVAIRLNASSTECNQFSRLYPVICVPSVSFIDGGNGVYIEAIAGAVSPQELREKIKNVIAAREPPLVSDPQVSSAPVIASDKPEKVQVLPSASALVNTSNETTEERAHRLRQKMAALKKKMEKEREENRANSNQASAVATTTTEAMDAQTSTLQIANPHLVASLQTEYQKEIERRKVGKAMQEQIKKNQEIETRAPEEHKQEDQYRKLVREQLEWDKLEKKARFEAEKRERDEKQQSSNIQKLEQLDEDELERNSSQMESARIQFRLPDGSTFTNRFQATATLSEVHKFIKQKIMSHNLRRSFVMSTMYPMRNYDSSDMGRTLTELHLVPSASIIVQPIECKKEKERREVGKVMQEQIKKNQEMETRAAEKFKKEEQQRRKLVREQLEWDKLDKEARFKAEKRGRAEKRESSNIQKPEQLDEEELERKSRRKESAKIQFRLPDGSTFTNRFQATATLSEVHEFIKQKIKSDDLRRSFMMSTRYPLKNYGSGDMSHTLTELNFVPCSSIFVLPGKNRADSNQASAVATTREAMDQAAAGPIASAVVNTSNETIEEKAYRWQKMVAFQELGEKKEELLAESCGTPKVASDQPGKVETSSSASAEVSTSNETIEEKALLQEKKENLKKEEGSLPFYRKMFGLWNWLAISSSQPSIPSARNLQSHRQGSTSYQSFGEPGPSTGATPKRSCGNHRIVPSHGVRQEENIESLSEDDEGDESRKMEQ